MKNIEQIVTDHLKGVSYGYLGEVVNFGIHHLTSDFHGDSDADYEAFDNEFRRQAEALLDALDNEIYSDMQAGM